MQEIDRVFDLLIKNAQKLAELQSNVILALICMGLGYIVWYDRKEGARRFNEDLKVREAKAITENTHAAVMVKLADGYERLADKMETIIEIVGGRK